jgi:DNA transposition AAA+ family ATPase
LLGNEHVYSNLTGGNRAAYLDRLYSRVGQRLRLNAADPGDAEAIISAWQIKANDCRNFLHKIAATPGGLRSLTKTLRLASMYAAGESRETNCGDIKAAWKRLGGAA